ncbi:MAG: DPP IV N-terminal domain-containing protein [Phycisphaerales bacterium]
MNTRSNRLPTTPVLMLALAGTLAALPACGAKRAGFWDKNKQSQVQSQQAARANQMPARTSSYLAAHDGAESDGWVAPRRGALRSNGSATIDAMAAESGSGTGPGSFTPAVTGDETGTGDAYPRIASTETPSTVNQPAPIKSSSETTDSLRLGTADAPEPVEREPYFTSDTESPAALRSGDISAFVYANAMGVELPSETNGDAMRATINVRQVTRSYSGSDFDPIVSPDGQHLIFASTQHRPTADLYIKSVSGSVVTRLTDDPAQDVMPSISPDGRFIAFASDRAGTWDLYIMPFEGGKVVQLTAESANDLHPTWSPDGTQVAFCRLGQQSGRWEIWVKDVLADKGPQFIGFGLFPEWCPTQGTGIAGADQILFQRSRERGDRAFSIWTLDYNPRPGTAGRETEIATGANHALINPAWSPDGKFITFAAVPNSQSWASGQDARPDSSTIWMVSTAGTGKVKLTNGDSIDLMPVWGRDNEIYFVSNMDGQDHLWSMELSPAIRAASVMMPDIGDSFANAPTDGDEE